MKYLEFHVQLKRIEPPIWRRFQIRKNCSFYDLHLAIQACGWFGGHLWAFLDESRETIAGIPDPEFGAPCPDAREVRVSEFFGQVFSKCTYIYDFGDGWEHEVRLTREIRCDEDLPRKLLDGARCFPPEDCGGIPGYERVLEFRRTGRDPWGEDASLEESIGTWEPEEFQLIESQASFKDTSSDKFDMSFEML